MHQVWIRDRFSKKVFTLPLLADTILILIMILETQNPKFYEIDGLVRLVRG